MTDQAQMTILDDPRFIEVEDKLAKARAKHIRADTRAAAALSEYNDLRKEFDVLVRELAGATPPSA